LKQDKERAAGNVSKNERMMTEQDAKKQKTEFTCSKSAFKVPEQQSYAEHNKFL
jgi:hypothetical protein